jgi:outer membrane immunogenic protein
MRKTALAAALLGALAATPAAAGSNWSGFYVGAAGSYNAATVEDTLGSEGPGITGLVGYDGRINRFVLGAWAEYGWKTFDWASVIDVDVKGWAVGGRAGFLVTDTAMLFVSAGYTQADADLTFASVDLSGVVVGGGAEIDLSHGFFLRPEYRYTRYEVDDLSDIDATVHEARLGLVYKFSVGNDVLPAFESKPLK